MDTNRIKKFASEARAILKRGVAAKMLSLGFDANGHIDEAEMPLLIQGGAIFRGQQHSEAFYHQWMSLHKRIRENGIKEVYEEAAYTWFNRFIAIRILQKNGLCEPVLDFVDVARTPHIVDAARMGHHPQMSAAEEEQLRTLLADVAAVTPQFALLITAYCHNNPIIYKCFGGIADYTELLLPNDILAENGFIDTLNHTEFITDEDFASPELIGWLYQFYISERKDEVFAKKGKFEADEIPAATQIFTPNWIVKYMVQNTVGRIYLDNNPWATDLKDKWKYLVEPSEPAPEEAKLMYRDLTELRVGDLACGSGHILNECFDLLFDLYIEDGYSRSEAIEAIFKYNLTGIDLDTRAKQLATFALLLKACQRDRSFADAHVMPNILNMPEPQKDEEALKGVLHHFFKGGESAQDVTALLDAFRLMRDADSLGSIMIFDIPDSTRALIRQTVEYYDEHTDQQEYFTEILPAMRLILALTEKYHALVMNPPYLEGGNMNKVLSNYVNTNYLTGKNDLYSVFMLLSTNHLYPNGRYGMINMDTWTFKSSFVSLRNEYIQNYNIDSILFLGARTFEELSGEVVQNVAFVITKSHPYSPGLYFSLGHNSTCGLKEMDFVDKIQNGVSIVQSHFLNLPNRAISIVSTTFIDFYEKADTLSDIGVSKQGLATGNNDRFVRLWSEVDNNRISYNTKDVSSAFLSKKKWFPYNKGGSRRKWYGNQELVVNWENDGFEIKHFTDDNGKLRSRPQNTDYYFKPSISWGLISGPFFRIFPQGFIYDIQGMSYFPNGDINLFDLMSWMNSIVFRRLGKSVNPREQYQAGDLLKLPNSTHYFGDIAELCYNTSKLDWDSHETSWDFEANPLVALRNKKVAQGKRESSFCLSDLVEEFEAQWTERFYQLHENEEELNRQFISIYGLEDELTPDVPLSEITILQQGEISVIDN